MTETKIIIRTNDTDWEIWCDPNGFIADGKFEEGGSLTVIDDNPYDFDQEFLYELVNYAVN